MKICFFDFITIAGGATKGSVHLLERIQNQNIDVHAINVYSNCHEYLEDLKQANVNYTVLITSNVKNTIGFKDSRVCRIFELIRQLPIMMLILWNLFISIYKLKPTHMMVNNRKSLIFVFIFKFIFGFKIIYYYRIEASQKYLSKHFIFLLNRVVDHLFCHSKNAIQNMKKFGVVKEIVYLPNCIKMDQEIKVIEEKDSEVFRIFLNAGRIVREKGYHTAVYALNELTQKNYNVILQLPGSITDHQYYNELQDYIYKNNLENRVIFCGWLNQVQQEVANSDCMILPSYSEGFPRSIIEAMLLKVPICATPVGGIPEAIIDNQTGFLFDVNDYIAMANKIELLITQPETRKNIVNNAYLFASQHFDESLNTQIFINNVNLND